MFTVYIIKRKDGERKCYSFSVISERTAIITVRQYTEKGLFSWYESNARGGR